jgi:16S rRNA (guanine966-N2)-methyltransferase
VLDAFAGSGAMGLEALSRGAATLVLFDTADEALEAIRRNVAHCRENERARIERADATRPPSATRFGGFAPCTLLFLDPPYGQGLFGASLAALDRAGWVAPGAMRG